MRLKIKVDGRIILRKVKFVSLGNFVMNVVRYKNKEYLVGNGDEYMRGYERISTLGSCLTD